MKASGVGAGSAQTTFQEGAVCVVGAYYSRYKTFNIDMNKVRTIRGAYNISRTRAETTLAFLENNPAWMDTTRKTIELIFKNFKITPQHVWHRGSPFFSSIYTQFQTLLKPVNKIGLRIADDKWNPSDIWIAKGFGNKITRTPNLPEYNKFIAESHKGQSLVGLSLKKLSKYPKLQVYNLGNKEPKAYSLVKVVRPVSPANSKAMDLEMNDKMLVRVRTFNYGKNAQAEITGRYAQHGKIGFRNIDFLVNKMTGKSWTTVQDIAKWNREDKIQKIRDLYNELGFSYTLTQVKNDFARKSFKTAAIEDDFYASKIQALELSTILKNHKQGPQIVNALMGYASSRGLEGLFQTSVFGKIF